MAYTAFCSNENRLFFCVILICRTLFWLPDEAFYYKGFICSSVIRAGAYTDCTTVKLNLRFPSSRTGTYYTTRHRISLYQFNAGMFCLSLETRALQWARASSFTRFLDHTERPTTHGRTPLDEWSAQRRDLYLSTHNRQTVMPPVRFEPTISAGEWPQTYALDRAATGTGSVGMWHLVVQISVTPSAQCYS